MIACILYESGWVLSNTQLQRNWSHFFILHVTYALNGPNQVSVTTFTFGSSACKRSQAAGTSPYWSVCARWALKVRGSGEPASPAGTRQLWLAPSEPEEKVPYGGHRKAVSSCGGPSARVPSGSSHSWDSWPSPHSSACRILRYRVGGCCRDPLLLQNWW